MCIYIYIHIYFSTEGAGGVGGGGGDKDFIFVNKANRCYKTHDGSSPMVTVKTRERENTKLLRCYCCYYCHRYY